MMLLKLLETTLLFFYAIVTKTSDINRMNELDELEINSLKRSFGEWVVNEKNLDSRKIMDLTPVRAHVDGRS